MTCRRRCVLLHGHLSRGRRAARIAVHDLGVDAVGRMGLREDGRFGFLGVDLTAHVVTDAGQEEAAVEAARHAEQGCLPPGALDRGAARDTCAAATAA